MEHRLQKLFDLSGRVALVTGASAGLGRHFADTLAAAGADVAVAARRIDECAEVARGIEARGRRAMAVQLDVTEAGSVHRAVATVGKGLGAVDVLVNNAGVVVTKPLLEVDETDWQRVVDTNLNGAWRVAQAVARVMVEAQRGGVIINIASLLALRVAAGVPAYAATKAGLVQLTRAMAVELAHARIRVNAIAPGYVETDMNRDFLRSEPGRKLIRRIPMGRVGDPADLDGALLLLASDASGYVTGAVVPVDGGHAVSPV